MADQIKEIRSKSKEILDDVKGRTDEAYETASNWLEGNSFTLLAIGAGVAIAGLVTFFIARARSGREREEGDSVHQAA